MNKVVLDTSAVLAYLFEEAGADKVSPILETGSGLISSVNYAELVSKLIDHGMPPGDHSRNLVWLRVGAG